MASQLVLIRHGETEWSKSGRHTSHSELGLTAKGEEAARSVNKAVSEFRFSHIFVSPRQRAIQTAQLVFGEASRLEQSPLLTEWEYGDYEGLTTPEIHQKDPDWDLWTAGCPGGESPEQVASRADEFLAKASSLGGSIAVVSHGHFLRVLTARYIRLPVSTGRHFILSTATLSVLSSEHNQPAIERWNESA